MQHKFRPFLHREIKVEGAGVVVNLGKYGCGAAEDIYFWQFQRMLVDNCGLKPPP